MMDTKKITYEEAQARFRHSLEVKRAAEKRLQAIIDDFESTAQVLSEGKP